MMKLSEAIRLSPLVTKTIYGPVFKRDWRGRVCGACRIGLVAMAAGYRPARWLGRPEAWATARDCENVYTFINTTWPWTQQTANSERDCLWFQGVVSYMVYAHESARLSAEEIATAVEGMEAKYDHPVTMDVTPNTAGDAVQLQEVL